MDFSTAGPGKMLYLALFAFLVSFALAGHYQNGCAKQLAATVFSPQAPYKEYLETISRELANIADIYDTQVGIDVVKSFTQKYQTIVAILDAFGGIDAYLNGNPIPSAQRGNVFSNRDARSVLNLGAYSNDAIIYSYSFLSFSKNGVVYEVSVGHFKADMIHN